MYRSVERRMEEKNRNGNGNENGNGNWNRNRGYVAYTLQLTNREEKRRGEERGWEERKSSCVIRSCEYNK